MRKLCILSSLILAPIFQTHGCSSPLETLVNKITPTVTPYYGIRSQAVDAARELAGWTQHVNLFDMDKVYGTCAITTEYTKSFLPDHIAASLFGTAQDANQGKSASIIISGSQVPVRGPNDWLADYFYLPTDFLSTINISPHIENIIVDMNFYLGLDEWLNGLFFRIHAPINWTRWSLDYKETVSIPGNNDNASGYFNSYDIAPGTPAGGVDGIGIQRGNLLDNFTSFINGDAPTNITDGTKLDGLCFAKINSCNQEMTKTCLTDLAWIIGWNFLNGQDYHFGLGIKAVAPTGNRPEGLYAFEPICGNGKHWELGGHITTHAQIWQSDEEDTTFGFYLDANITHLFNARQTRTFDLCGKPVSRYMIAQKLGAPVVGLSGGTSSNSSTPPSAQFQKEFSPVANLTTQQVLVSIGVQADLAAQFTYASNGLTIDLGYNLWTTSCEKIKPLNNNCTIPTSCTACLTAFTQNNWALKGDAYIFGFDEDTPIALSATESKATINSGTNFPASGAATQAQISAGSVNPNIDNAQLAFNGAGGAVLNADPSAMFGQTNTSINPIFIQSSDINFTGITGLSNKVYGHISYNWIERKHWIPYAGIGGFAEFGLDNQSCLTTSCVTSSLTQWGLWIKVGISFK